MHIPDGILPASVCVAGYAATGVITWRAVHRVNRREDPYAGIPRASLLTAAFFVASWIHIPLPPTSVHPLLNGLLGALLGPYAFLAILVGLFFQAAMFQHGGLTTLGVNAVLIGVPAVIAGWVFRRHTLFGSRSRAAVATFGFGAGALAVILSAAAALALLIGTLPHPIAVSERTGLYALTLGYLPVAVIEGAFSAMVILFLARVKPELLEG